MAKRIIAHLDMDAFYAAIEERDNPQFAGKPIVVGADPKEGRGRGVVSAANYEARKFGIGSAMPISRAYRLAPKAIFLPTDFPKYQRVSEQIFKILRAKVPLVEEVGIDEACLDLTDLGSYQKAVNLVKEIKEEIKTKEKLTASVGIGPNKLVAKIASDKNKPDGLTVIKPTEVYDFLAPLDIKEIPGIGPKTAQRFYQKKIRTIGELRKLNKEKLVTIIGSFGNTLFDLARGKDPRPVGEARPLKSVGKQTTFEEDTADPKVIGDTVLGLAKDVWEEMVAKAFEPTTFLQTIEREKVTTSMVVPSQIFSLLRCSNICKNHFHLGFLRFLPVPYTRPFTIYSYRPLITSCQIHNHLSSLMRVFVTLY